MQTNECQNKPTQQKTIRMENELIKKIDELRKGTERSFAQQVKYMLKEYIKIKEG